MNRRALLRTGWLAWPAAVVACRRKDATPGNSSDADAAGGESVPERPVLRVGVAGDAESGRWGWLDDELGVTVEEAVEPDSRARMQAFRAGDVMLIGAGGLTGLQLRALVPGAQVIARRDPLSRSCLLVHRSFGGDSSQAIPESLGDLLMVFGHPESVAGRLMPQYFLEKETGREADEFFGQGMSFTGADDVASRSVREGVAAAVPEEIYGKQVADGIVDPDEVRVVWTSPPFADRHWIVHPEFDSRFGSGALERVRAALRAGRGGPSLAAAGDDDFVDLRQIAVRLGMLSGNQP